MRAFSTFFLLSLMLFVYVCDARKDPGDYWKSIMNGEPMPKAITDLIHRYNLESDSNMKMDYFIKNFNTKANVIIYHSHHKVHSDHKPKVSNMKLV
ncbi:hypothetical protein CDL12_05169 [Handroanthus impetiginosus]|uniref:Organ specific protein n=1 Tax=Handroanthus impetiginosus TaxID=429701 RepID=A0A2G9HXB1_9LAMI|nr:hypothetical protein CDL12_05169 [Handroanthus impetiginosus]